VQELRLIHLDAKDWQIPLDFQLLALAFRLAVWPTME